VEEVRACVHPGVPVTGDEQSLILFFPDEIPGTQARDDIEAASTRIAELTGASGS
jgi:hypothetical protein